MPEIEIVRFKTLSAIYTGGIERESKQVKTSAINGSLRWWYEALVRGLGGYACDPTGPDSCLFDNTTYQKSHLLWDGLKDVCPACRFFGCTGWAHKFHLRINGNRDDQEVILNKPGIDFSIEFLITKPMLEEERWLLSKTVWLIAQYGAMGGKTTIKPPRFPDYGLVRIAKNITSPLAKDEVSEWIEQVMLDSEVLSRKQVNVPPEYPNLRYFFFNRSAWLNRQQMNDLVAADVTGFMRGAKGISKKLFSFSKEGRRFWGYTTGDEMLRVVLEKLSAMGVNNTKIGKEVIDEL